MAIGTPTYRWFPPPKKMMPMKPSYLLADDEYYAGQNVYYENYGLRTRPDTVSAGHLSGSENVLRLYSWDMVQVSGARKDLMMFTDSCMAYYRSAAMSNKFNSTYPNLVNFVGSTALSTGMILCALSNLGKGARINTTEFFDISGTRPQLLFNWAPRFTRIGLNDSGEIQCGPLVRLTSATASAFPVTVSNAGGYAADVSARIYCLGVKNYAAHCCLFNVWETSTSYPQRVRWCRLAKMGATDWAAENYNDLVDTPGAILAEEALGRSMIIYKEDSIYSMTHIGTELATFRFEEVVHGEGIIGPDAVIRVQNAHFFVGNNNVYKYYGGSMLEEIGDPIWAYIRGIVSVDKTDGIENRRRIFAFHMSDLNLVGFGLPNSTLGITSALMFDYVENAWSYWYWFIGESMTMNDATEQLGVTTGGVFFGSGLNKQSWLTGDNQLFYFNRFSAENDSKAGENFFTTKSVHSSGGMDHESTWDQIVFYARSNNSGDQITVDYEVDYGGYQEIGTVTLSVIYIDFPSRLFRMNFAATGKSIHFRFRFHNATVAIEKWGVRETIGEAR